MKNMKAWVVTAPRKLELMEIPVPTPGPGEILVKILYACLCNGSDPGIYYGHEAYAPPFVFGHEAVGEVVQAGAGVTGWTAGDTVFCWCAVGALQSTSSSVRRTWPCSGPPRTSAWRSSL